ncbi:MAG: hypothetical protein NWQ19_07545 [Nonlabens sp.]|nr:hypothetical protein [Nonlabens sp.]
MKTLYILIPLLVFCSAMNAQGVGNVNPPEMLVKTMTVDTISDLPSLETLARLAPINELSPDRLTARVQASSIPYKRLPLRYDAREDILPSIRNYYGQPDIDFNSGNQFESMYRVTNLAFYEANRNSVMSLQFNNGVCVNPL